VRRGFVGAVENRCSGSLRYFARAIEIRHRSAVIAFHCAGIFLESNSGELGCGNENEKETGRESQKEELRAFSNNGSRALISSTS
jgi:hypothetical protein